MEDFEKHNISRKFTSKRLVFELESSNAARRSNTTVAPRKRRRWFLFIQQKSDLYQDRHECVTFVSEQFDFSEGILD